MRFPVMTSIHLYPLFLKRVRFMHKVIQHRNNTQLLAIPQATKYSACYQTAKDVVHTILRASFALLATLSPSSTHPSLKHRMFENSMQLGKS